MSCRERRGLPPTDRPPSRATAPLPKAERLVLVGVRAWVAGYETGDVACWEVAWNEFARELGTHAAKPLVSELACWVRALRGAARRDLVFFPSCCGRLTSDEALCLALVAGCQQHAGGAAKAAAFQLLGSNDLDDVLALGSAFATALLAAGLRLAGDPALRGDVVTSLPTAPTRH